MCNSRSLHIALGGVVLVAASAAYALACSPYFPTTPMQLQSLTIDGVEQTDLTRYQKGPAFIIPTYINARPDSVDIGYGSGEGETYDPK